MGNVQGHHGEQIDDTGYRYGTCHLLVNKDTVIDLPGADTHYSFDTQSRNVHIVPKRNVAAEDQVERIKAVRRELAEALIGTPRGTGALGTVRGISDDIWPTQKCVLVHEGAYDYLLGFETLYLAGNEVHCLLGQLQYFRYAGKGVNCPSAAFNGLLYPSSCKPDDHSPKQPSSHCIYNSELTIYDDSAQIQREFNRFVAGKLVAWPSE